MTCYLNGQTVDLNEGTTLQAALEAWGYIHADAAQDNPYPRGQFVVAVNGSVVPASAYASTQLAHGHQIDVLGAITGG